MRRWGKPWAREIVPQIVRKIMIKYTLWGRECKTLLMIETAPGEEVVARGEECRGAGLGGGGGRLDGDHDVCKDFV